MGYAYPYNPAANDASCIVKNEAHALSEYTNKWRCVVPIYAPFFRDSLIIIHVDTGRTLLEGLDYYLTHYCKAASALTKRSIFGSIMLTMPLTGQLEFRQYTTLGGQFNVRRSDVLIHLADTAMIDPRNEDWEAVMRYIRPVEAIDPPDNIEEAISQDIVAAALDSVVSKYTELNVSRVTAIKALFKYIWDNNKFLKVPPGGTKSVQYYGLRNMIVDYDLIGHQYRHDPHNITYQQLNAYGKDDPVAAATMVYTLRLDEIIEFIYFCGVNDVVLDRLYDLAGGEFTGGFGLTDAAESMISSSKGTGTAPHSQMNFAGGNLTVKSFHGITMQALEEVFEQLDGFPISAGNNILMLSDNDADHYPATFNGNRFISYNELDEAIRNAGSAAAQKVNLRTDNSSTIKLTGNGSQTPLRATLVRWQATTSVPGMFMFAVPGESSQTKIASAAEFKAASENVDKYALSSYKVNGKPLTSNIVLKALDFDLDKVNNTRLYEKVLSTPFITEVNGKALLGHTHDFANMTFNHATATSRGLVKLTDTYSATDVTNAATPQILIPFKTQYDEVATIATGKFSKAWVNIAKFTKGTSSFAGWTVHINADNAWNVRGYTGVSAGADFNLTLLFPDDYREKTFYINAELDLVKPSAMTLSLTEPGDDTLTRTRIGTVITSSSGVVSVTLVNVMRFINVAELVEHAKDKEAHGWADRMHAVGLPNLRNRPLSDLAVIPSFSTVFSSWYRFSHSGSSGFPANASELATWAYNPANDTITNTTNSATYIGLVSNETVGDYEFDVLLSSTNSDDDWVGLVLAFYKDPATGKEYTVSVLRVLNGDGGNKQANFQLVYNFCQSDAWTMSSQGPIIARGWNTAGVARVRAVRRGNKLDVYGYKFSSEDALQPLESSFTVDLESDPRLAKFMGESRYGYAAQSQTSSTWAPLVRPDADGTSKYASMEAVRTVAVAADALLLTSGTIANGASVPIPIGYTLANVRCIVVPYQQDSDTSGITTFTCDVDSALKVTCQVTTKNGITYPGTAKYYLYGVK